jgi:outer membrane protein OmpA-like peptidoglycan-associated protein
MDDMRTQRRERVEGGRTFIEEPDRRVIIREGGRTIIRHDETERFRRFGRDVRVEEGRGGERVTIYRRPDGVQIVSVVDGYGRLIRRSRRWQDGREVVLIENTPRFADQRVVIVDLAPPRISIPRERYIVESDRASREELYETLIAPPIEHLDRRYTLDEVRYNYNLRARMRQIDVDTINFEFGSWEVTPDQVPRLDKIAYAIGEVIRHNPDEVILIEGHTDAVGSDDDNLSLSDRRAESVANILTEQYQIPPENLTTQGYGEQFLKVDTQAPERQNRRVTVRRITPLLASAAPR